MHLLLLIFRKSEKTFPRLILFETFLLSLSFFRCSLIYQSVQSTLHWFILMLYQGWAEIRQGLHVIRGVQQLTYIDYGGQSTEGREIICGSAPQGIPSRIDTPTQIINLSQTVAQQELVWVGKFPTKNSPTQRAKMRTKIRKVEEK